MKPIFEAISEEFDGGKVKFMKVDTDEHDELVDTFNIKELPLFGLFIEGTMVASHSGALFKGGLRMFLEDSLKEHDLDVA